MPSYLDGWVQSQYRLGTSNLYHGEFDDASWTSASNPGITLGTSDLFGMVRARRVDGGNNWRHFLYIGDPNAAGGVEDAFVFRGRRTDNASYVRWFGTICNHSTAPGSFEGLNLSWFVKTNGNMRVGQIVYDSGSTADTPEIEYTDVTIPTASPDDDLTGSGVRVAVGEHPSPLTNADAGQHMGPVTLVKFPQGTLDSLTDQQILNICINPLVLDTLDVEAFYSFGDLYDSAGDRLFAVKSDSVPAGAYMECPNSGIQLDFSSSSAVTYYQPGSTPFSDGAASSSGAMSFAQPGDAVGYAGKIIRGMHSHRGTRNPVCEVALYEHDGTPWGQPIQLHGSYQYIDSSASNTIAEGPQYAFQSSEQGDNHMRVLPLLAFDTLLVLPSGHSDTLTDAPDTGDTSFAACAYWQFPATWDIDSRPEWMWMTIPVTDGVVWDGDNQGDRTNTYLMGAGHEDKAFMCYRSRNANNGHTWVARVTSTASVVEEIAPNIGGDYGAIYPGGMIPVSDDWVLFMGWPRKDTAGYIGQAGVFCPVTSDFNTNSNYRRVDGTASPLPIDPSDANNYIYISATNSANLSPLIATMDSLVAPWWCHQHIRGSHYLFCLATEHIGEMDARTNGNYALYRAIIDPDTPSVTHQERVDLTTALVTTHSLLTAAEAANANDIGGGVNWSNGQIVNAMGGLVLAFGHGTSAQGTDISTTNECPGTDVVGLFIPDPVAAMSTTISLGTLKDISVTNPYNDATHIGVNKTEDPGAARVDLTLTAAAALGSDSINSDFKHIEYLHLPTIVPGIAPKIRSGVGSGL